MGLFSYNLTILGDCNQSSSGYLKLEITSGGVPPYNFLWTSPNLGNDLGVTESERTNLSADTYIITITDSTLPNNLQEIVNIPITYGVCCNLSGVSSTTCGLFNGAVTAGTGTFATIKYVLYTQLDVYITSAETSSDRIVFNNLSANTYYILATDQGGCTGKSQSFIVENSLPLDFGLYVVPNSICSTGGLGKIYVTGQTGVSPYTYLWSNGETTDFITGLTTGSYSVQVTDSNNCVQSKSAVVGLVDPIGLQTITTVPPGCFTSDGSITFTFSGGTLPFFYSASTGLQDVNYSKSFTIPNIPSGNYSLQVTDAAFCRLVESTILNSPFGMTSVNVTTQNSTCSDNDGQLKVVVNGGTPPYTYTLITPDSSTINDTLNSNLKIFNGLSGGTYDLFVVDSTTCAFNNSYSIVTQNSFTISTSSTGSTNLTSTGIIEVTKTVGGTAPFTYTLDSSVTIPNTLSSAATFNQVSPGQHTIEVKDSLGCNQTQQVFVQTIQNVLFTLVPTSAGSNSSGTLTALILEGKPPFTFNWSANVPSNPQFIFVGNLSGGTYSLTISDGNNTSLTRTVVVPSLTNFTSSGLYTVGQEPFQSNTGIKNNMLNLLNEGFYGLTSANTECQLVSAIFTTKVVQYPLGTTLTDTFYTTTSLLVAPSDNLWYNSVRNLLLSILGVYDVIIDETNNQITIIGDLNNQSIVNTLEIEISLEINYDIDCSI